MIAITRNESLITAATKIIAAQENMHRTAIYITCTSGNAITIVKGNVLAAAGAGIVIQPNSTWFETNSEGFACWKGDVQVIGTGAGTIAVSETIEV
jgi:hypothetical protein